MHPLLKRTLLVIAAFFIAFGGYIVGYFQGYEGGVGHPALAQAYDTVTTLDTLRSGQIASAIQQLEIQLDTKLVMSANYKNNPSQLSKVFEFGSDEVIAKKVREYRTAHPSTVDDPAVQALIKNLIAESN
jgi:hypothetical protein